jgi:hypothetical protein
MKEQLITIVNAYAAARVSGDAMLQQFAAQQLGVFLEAVEITAKPVNPVPEEAPTSD